MLISLTESGTGREVLVPVSNITAAKPTLSGETTVTRTNGGTVLAKEDYKEVKMRITTAPIIGGSPYKSPGFKEYGTAPQAQTSGRRPRLLPGTVSDPRVFLNLRAVLSILQPSGGKTDVLISTGIETIPCPLEDFKADYLSAFETEH